VGAKTVVVEQIGNPCQQCGGVQTGKMHVSAEGQPEMLVIRCLKCSSEKRLYAGRREPRFRRGLVSAMGVKDRLVGGD